MGKKHLRLDDIVAKRVKYFSPKIDTFSRPLIAKVKFRNSDNLFSFQRRTGLPLFIFSILQGQNIYFQKSASV